jgi:phenylalanyl-tRNA synthetase beta chain
MIISYKWLLNYLPEPLPVEKLSQILTDIGLEVEIFEPVEAVKGSLKGLKIGEVLTCEKHPNADKLKVTTVNVGDENPLHIVCGAPNVAAGQRVVVATVGTTVHPTEGDSFLIKKAKIRGEESEGMICAEDEIGLGKSHAGIMILPEDAPIGLLAQQYFNIPEADYAIHIGLTPNRSDAMSHIGVARDVCAYLSHHKGGKYAVKMPTIQLPAKENALDIAVNIEAKDACLRYAGISISGVKIAASPAWLQQYLKTIEVRSINNVVDITNFVLHEFGQPLHAFDAQKIKGKQVNVRFLPQDSLFLSLDEKERKLQANDLMICDEKEGMCIAGVFGGANSSVTENTTDIFLESAYFHPTFVRRTSMHHGLRTDAATHFEKGVDINNVIPALQRAAQMICEIAGGKIASELVDVYPEKITPTKVTVGYDYIQKLSGKLYAPTAIKQVLVALGFEIEIENEVGLTLSVPTNKADVSQPADIVEELLRIDGLDNIAIPERLNISLMPTKISDRSMKEKIAELLCGEGFQEIVTNSIVNSKYYPDRTDLVRMLNSLSSELDVMRPSMLESGLEVIQYNCNRKNNDLLLFEFGNIYRKEESYVEEPQLALWISGNIISGQWNQKSLNVDAYFLKGIIQNLARKTGVNTISESIEDNRIVFKIKNKILASIEQVDRKRLVQFDVKQDVFYAVINWNHWYKTATTNKIRYTEIPKFPPVKRDLALVLDKTVTFQQIKETTEQLKLNGLQEFGLFDVFESEKIGADKKSLALNFTFQLTDRTLTDSETDALMQQLMNAYKNKLQAQIRE